MTDVWGINDSSQIVGNYELTHQTAILGFVYSGGSYTTIAVPGSNDTLTYGINDSGEMVGAYDLPGSTQHRGFLYSGGVYTTIDYPARWPQR